MPSVRPLTILLAAGLLTAGLVRPVGAQVKAEDVTEAVANIASGDRDRVVTGRTGLIGLYNLVRNNPPALAVFTRDLNNQLMPIATGNDPHAKLNTSIVIQRISEGGSADLAPIVTALINDSSAAVSTNGLRAASNVLPRMFATAKAGEQNPLVPAIVAAVKTHPESEAVAIEAYNAIVRILNDRTAADTLTAAGVTAATPRAIDAVHQLLAVRITQYGTGSLAEPNAEQPAVSFLGKQSTIGASSAAQKTMTVRLLLQLMEAAASEMGGVPATQPSGRLRLNDLRQLEKTAAGSLSVIAELSQKADLKTVVTDKSKNWGLATPVNVYKIDVAAIATEFYRVMPETKPATQPTTATPAP